MSVKVEFVNPTREYMEEIAKNMRESDMIEVKASHGYTPQKALDAGLELSDSCAVALVDGEPVAMFGLSKGTILSGISVPWLLGTDDLFKRGKEMIAWGRFIVSLMLRECDCLENYVHVRNRRSIVWLKRMGFELSEPKPYGVKGELFMKFTMRNEKCVDQQQSL